MRLSPVISRLLSILAILGLLIPPMATPSTAMTAAPVMTEMADMGAMPDNMPCCPDQKQSLPDCQKSCPLATICMAKCVPGVAQREFTLRRLDRLVNRTPYMESMREPTIGAPPDRPPRT